MLRQSAAVRGALCVMAIAGLAGCSTLGSVFQGEKIDYRSENSKSTVPKLEVPPDLVQLERDNRYSVPDISSGVATASDYNAQAVAHPTVAGASGVVAPKSLKDMHIERAGSQRWLVVHQSPEALWPKIKEFWQDSGFTLEEDNPQSGVIETDWVENRAKLPQDFIRRTVGKVFNSLYSTGERDQFRTRIERGSDGTTEIYIVHHGAQEVLTGRDKDVPEWTMRPSDPDLEAEFLARLMARLAGQEPAPVLTAQAKEMVANAVPQPPHAKLTGTKADQHVEVDDGFERAWRRVGLALDRAGFTVEDRDRTQGVYFVRYFDQGAAISSDKSLFARWFSSKKDKKAERYRIVVKEAGAGSSNVTVQNNDGTPEETQTGTRILTVLAEQLK